MSVRATLLLWFVCLVLAGCGTRSDAQVAFNAIITIDVARDIRHPTPGEDYERERAEWEGRRKIALFEPPPDPPDVTYPARNLPIRMSSAGTWLTIWSGDQVVLRQALDMPRNEIVFRGKSEYPCAVVIMGEGGGTYELVRDLAGDLSVIVFIDRTAVNVTRIPYDRDLHTRKP